MANIWTNRIRRIIDLTGVTLIVVTGTAFAYLWVRENPREPPRKSLIIMDLTASWIDADNITHTVHTVQDDGESLADFIARHKAAVAALKAEYPPA